MLRRFRSDPLKYALDLASYSFLLNVVLLIVVGLMWNTYGDISEINAISVGLTTIEIFLVIVALGGFWILRGNVQTLAFEVSQQAAEEATKSFFEEFKPELRRRVEELVAAELEERMTAAPWDEDLDFSDLSYDIARAMDDENGGTDD